MIISATFSKPNNSVLSIFGKELIKIKITAKKSDGLFSYFMEKFTKTQVFHEHLTETQLKDFIDEHAGKTFKNCVIRTENEETIILANKKGKITRLSRPQNIKFKNEKEKLLVKGNLDSRKKNYIIPEGSKVPFMTLLGIMSDEGKVISSKYDKFRQINRYLEFIDDILDDVTEKGTLSHPLRIADFGCGKSYLTFAVHYFLTEIKKIPCQIEGLDLKKDVINYCNELVKKLNLTSIIFHTGNIADYEASENPDLVITLHACDTATDFALKYAVSHKAKAILSVPCCQHQINSQLNKNQDIFGKSNLAPLLKWGIIREKFASLLTDSLRGEWLEAMGYKVQMLEFIDMEHTPKNILIRAIKKSEAEKTFPPRIIEDLKISPEIFKEK